MLDVIWVEVNKPEGLFYPLLALFFYVLFSVGFQLLVSAQSCLHGVWCLGLLFADKGRGCRTIEIHEVFSECRRIVVADHF